MDTLPLVSIGVLNYNYSKYVVEALDSSANQTYLNIELIIIDDCSTDDSVAVIETWIRNHEGSITIKFIKNAINLGLTKNCNLILNNANGKYFQTLDADDILLHEKIEKQVALLENSDNTALIYSNVAVINEEGIITNPDYCSRIGYDKDNMPQGNIFNDLLDFNFISLPSVLVNTAYAKAAGGFDETLRVQDYYMRLQLAQKYQVQYMSENTALYRVHDSSMSNSNNTYPISVDSVLNLKYRYYKYINHSQKKKMAKNIQYASVYLYQSDYPTSKKWVTIAFSLNPGFKTLVYFFAIRFGIPFSFFDKMKSKLKSLKGHK